MTADELDALRHEVRTAAYQIIVGKGRTNLAIGLATARIVRAIAHDEQAVLPVSVRTEVDGVGEVCLSLPAVVGRRGVRSLLAVPMDTTEQAGLPPRGHHPRGPRHPLLTDLGAASRSAPGRGRSRCRERAPRSPFETQRAQMGSTGQASGGSCG